MKYLYSGPVSAVTLADGTEVMLYPGKIVELPADHEYTATLLALSHLTPVAEPPKGTPAKAKTAKKEE